MTKRDQQCVRQMIARLSGETWYKSKDHGSGNFPYVVVLSGGNSYANVYGAGARLHHSWPGILDAEIMRSFGYVSCDAPVFSGESK